MPTQKIDDDTPVWGARRIAEVLGFFNERGEPDEDAVYYAHRAKLLPIDKVGRRLISTPRRLKGIATGKAVTATTTT